MNTEEIAGDVSSEVDAFEGLDLGDARTREILEASGVDVPKGEDATEQPVETVNDTTSQDESQVDADKGTEQSSEDSEKKEDPFENAPKGFKKQLKRKERQVGRLAKELEEAKKKLAEYDKPEFAPKQKRSKDSFASEEDYIEHVTLDRIRTMQKESEKSYLQQDIQQKEYQQLAETWEEKIVDNFESEEEQAEYERSLQKLGHPAEVFDNRINEYIFKSPNGPKMLKYFSEHKSAINTLNDMHDWDLSGTLQKISSYVATKSTPDVTPAKTVSRAQGPMGKLGTGTKGATQTTEEMSGEEALAYYRKHGKLPT